MKNLPLFAFSFLASALIFPLIAQEEKEESKPEKQSEESAEKSAEKEGEEQSADHKRLGELFRKGWEKGKTFSEKEAAEFTKLLVTILPGKDYLGDDLEWRIKLTDTEGEKDKVSLNLAKKDAGPYERLMWFDIFYKEKPEDYYGGKKFEGYSAMGIPGVHQFVIIGNIEIRAVAASTEYRSDAKISEVLKAFPLAEIANL